jgi:ABC-type lipoprotein release transport system permease subunit
MLMFKIAWRNIFRQKRRTILTVLTMFGGIVLSAISIGWADGTYNRIINMFTRNQLGHIQIHAVGYMDKPSMYKNIIGYDTVGVVIDETEAVSSWTPRLYSAGLISVGEKSVGAQIIGVDPEREELATRFSKKVIDGSGFGPEAGHQAILGKGVAKTLKATVGDEVVVFTQAADGSLANDLYTIAGIIESGNAAVDQTAFYLHLHDAQELLVLEGRVHEIAVVVRDLKDVGPVTGQLKDELSTEELEILPWQEFAHAFYMAMKADMMGAWIMLFIIILIVAIGVFNTVLMTVLERLREYGVLRAVGTQPVQVFRLVIYEVSIMAMLSIVVGLGLSILANYYLSQHGIPMPQEFTYGGMEFTHYYAEVNFRSLFIPGLTVLLAAVLVSLFPAAKAARTAPAKAMRTH